jgi:hypothetical protein
MKLEGIPQPLRKVWEFVGLHWLLILLIVLALVLAAALVVFLMYQSRKKAAPAPAAGAAARPAAPPAPHTGQLRDAWVRFLRKLPQAYRRSLLNFEHFVLMGAASSGKTKLVDDYSDWRRQTKEFASSQPNDPDLPVYLASSEVITELPARVLEDHGEAVYRALNRLWRPIYKERGPTVVCVVDVARLKDSTPDLVVDLAEKMRGKINVLSTIRGRPIEVRVALSRLDQLEGYKEFAAFCRDREIPVRVTPPTDGSKMDLPTRLDAWFEEIRGLIPTVLTSLRSGEYRKIVTFLRDAPVAVGPIKPFLKALFQHEALVPDPVYGGVFFGSDPPGAANPLFGALERGPGPDPQRRHAIISALLAGATLAYMGLAFQAQYDTAETAIHAFESYNPNDPPALELAGRDSVCAFTSRTSSWIERHPDFYADVRHDMRKSFSSRIRDQFLIKRLHEVAKKGTMNELGGTPMAARRTIFYLGLIHSDKRDRLKILEPEREQTWISMIELPTEPNFIRDYLMNVDTAYKDRVDFDLTNLGADVKDSSKDWIEFVDQLGRALEDEVVTKTELHQLQKMAKELQPRTTRFMYDHVVRDITGKLDTAAGTETYRNGERVPGPLERFYSTKYDNFLRNARWASDEDLMRSLRRVVETVNATAIDVAHPHTLEELVFRLEQLYDEPTDSAGDAGAVTRVNIDGQDKLLPAAQWQDILRNSKADQYIEAFGSNVDQSIFFDPDIERSLPPVIWNANGEMALLFTGRAVLRGRYTQAAYDHHIRDVVLRLARVVERAKISSEVRDALYQVVGDQVGRYGQSYREEVLRFIQVFDVQARSTEELRVVLAQMSADSSAFNDFVVAVDKNVRLDSTGHKMLEPIKGALAEFEAWRKVVDGGTAPEIGKYKSTLGQLLLDLGPASEKGGGAAAPAASAAPAAGPAAGGDKAPPGPGDTETLEKAIGPAGKRYLAEIRGEVGSYSFIVESWLTSVSLPENERKPFRAPLRRLAELGRVDIDKIIWRVWQTEMFPGVQQVAVLFPFNPSAKEEATPQMLKDLFHPQEGKFFDLFHRYIEPLAQSSPGDKPPYHPRGGAQRALSLPPNMFPAINAAALLSSRLWDPATGNPTPLELKIATVPFDRELRARVPQNQAATLTYLNIGDGSVFNFNQKPSLISVGFEWNKDLRSQVGVQLTDLGSKENNFPPPIVSNGQYWSFYHLLRLGKPSGVKSPPSARLYTWDIQNQRDNAVNEVLPVKFVTVNDPWEPFAGLGRFGWRPPRETPRPKGAR